MKFEKIGDKGSVRDLANRGIDYGKVRKNYEMLVTTFKRNGISEQEAQKLAGTFTLEELNDDAIRIQVGKMINAELISLKPGITKTNIYDQVKELTPRQIREKGLDIKDITELLTIIGLDTKLIKGNDEAVKEWMLNSGLISEYRQKKTKNAATVAGGLEDTIYTFGLGQLASPTFKKTELENKTATEVLKEKIEDMSYEEAMALAGNNESTRARIFKLLGIEDGKGKEFRTNYNSMLQGLQEQGITTKKAKEIIAKMKVGELADSKYIETVKELMQKGVLSVDEIGKGKDAIKIILEGKSYTDMRKAIGDEEKIEKILNEMGIEGVKANADKLMAKAEGNIVDEAIIGSMKISELADSEAVDVLVKDYDKQMPAKRERFKKGITTNAQIEEVVEVEQEEVLREALLEYNPLTECVEVSAEAAKIISIGQVSRAKAEESFVGMMKAAGIGAKAAERVLGYIVENIGHKGVIIEDLEEMVGINGGLEIMLKGETNNHVVAIKGISKDGIVSYAVNVKKDKGGIIEGKISIAALEKGVYLEDNGELREAREGDSKDRKKIDRNRRSTTNIWTNK